MSIIGAMYEGGGAKPQAWPKVGTRVQGTILKIREKQGSDFKTKRPEVWPDGSPKMTPILTIQTDRRDGPEDDGKRDIYLRSNLFTAFREALQKAYATRPDDDDLVGATLTLKFHKTAPGTGQDRKLFLAHIKPKPASSVVGDTWDDELPPEPGEPASASNAPAGDWASDPDIPF